MRSELVTICYDVNLFWCKLHTAEYRINIDSFAVVGKPPIFGLK